MRTPSTNAVSYQPGDPPADPAQMQRFLREEQLKWKAALDALADGFAPVVYAPPAKPRDGMLRNADGTQWNPGSGAGLYRYGNNSWNYLG
ncbi:hypothetical protein SOM61_08450 [Massilia sp. CFBP9012]|uniref:hypothetical protein n=1 Tax=Massilia sp. CFBP9012 TaxID=3096531 RepID=UPI002A6B5398|nr:hypothetical protein [Massilia sp. CFBP9012]MDY0974990.1 hypothetical protein [Massilia sp. CFBP9012]